MSGLHLVSRWRKPRRSVNNGNCVEVSKWRFRKSATSVYNGNCAEVGSDGGLVAVRDTADRGGRVLFFPARSWAAFINRIRQES